MLDGRVFSAASARNSAPSAVKLLNDGKNTDRKSTRLNSSHSQISYAVFCLKKKKKNFTNTVLQHHNKNEYTQYNNRAIPNTHTAVTEILHDVLSLQDPDYI